MNTVNPTAQADAARVGAQQQSLKVRTELLLAVGGTSRIGHFN